MIDILSRLFAPEDQKGVTANPTKTLTPFNDKFCMSIIVNIELCPAIVATPAVDKFRLVPELLAETDQGFPPNEPLMPRG